ncbi:terpene synthase family protein [Nonomuraea sp. NPDC005650]|uniref:terpene synthase family protein n=1 Tax=Nonomuraea sp. NPDC005650 TaxID=3157045 RepID=UPI0033A8A14F
MERFDLFRDDRQKEYYRRAHIGRLVGRSIPDGLPGPLQAATNYYSWLFVFDDAVSDETENGTPTAAVVTYLTRLARVLTTPGTPMPHDDKLAMSSLDIRSDLAENGTPAQTYRWIDQVHDYFTGLSWEAAIRETDRPPSLNDYIMLWQKSSATESAFAFLEPAHGYLLTAEELHDPRIHALRDIATALVGWGNDIISYNKEAFRAARYDFPAVLNLIPVLAAEHRCSMQEAADQAADMHDRTMRRLIELSFQVRPQVPPHTARFINGLCQWVRGSLDWHLASDRYSNPNNPGEHTADNVAMPAIRSSPANAINPAPLPIPAVSWWWDVSPFHPATPHGRPRCLAGPTGLGTSAANAELLIRPTASGRPHLQTADRPWTGTTFPDVGRDRGKNFDTLT